MRPAIMLIVLLGVAGPAMADSSLPPDPYSYSQLPDPRQEASAAALMQTIRCLVCQGQSIADSDAEMAGDMRAMVRRRISAGERPEAVRGSEVPAAAAGPVIRIGTLDELVVDSNGLHLGGRGPGR